MTSPARWDSLLSVSFLVDNTRVLDADGGIALGREINLPPGFFVSYDATARRFNVQFETTTLSHGALQFSTDGSLDAENFHHSLANPDPGGNPGFLSVEWATNLALYTGVSDPLAIGQFGISPDGIRWREGAVPSGREAATIFAARRWTGNIVDGVSWTAKDGDFLSAVGGSGAVIVLPSTDDVTALIISNVDGPGTVGTNSGVNTVEGLSSPSVPAGAAWLLIGPDVNGIWRRFVAS